jgi:hypothetical protein
VRAAIAAIAALVGLGQPAHAEDPHADHQPCVSNREWHGLYQQTKPELEGRWEVEGLGVKVVLPFGLVHQLVVYPRCDHLMEDAWYGITYKRRGKHLWAVWATQCETWKTRTSCLVATRRSLT